MLDQDPDPGQQAEENGTITLEVSNGPGDTRVPSVENLPQERAVKELNKAGFKVNLDTEPSGTVKQGFAIRTAPKEGTEVERGTRIRLLVSSGPARVQVPGVVGLLRESAESRLTSDGFDVTVRTEESDQPKDEVISQTPSAGTSTERGASVTITVSTGPGQAARRRRSRCPASPARLGLGRRRGPASGGILGLHPGEGDRGRGRGRQGDLPEPGRRRGQARAAR